MRHLFDTDVISALSKKRPPSLLVDRLKTIPPADQFISSVTVMEICYGAYRSADPSKHLQFLETRVLPRVTVLDFDDSAARTAGRVRAERERKGRPIAPLDLEIAATALANGCVVVTGNVRHFEEIPGLEVVNWIS